MDATLKTPTLVNALPFWSSVLLIPLMVFVAVQGGWSFLLVPMATWTLFGLLDAAIGRTRDGIDPAVPHSSITVYQAVTRVWPVLQAMLLVWLLSYVPGAAHLGGWEKVAVFVAMGILSGTVGINYSHELMHQPTRHDRWLADFLLSMTFYGHFRSEHLLVHHRYVGTPRDPVTARYDEGFHRFFFRVLPQCYLSAVKAEAEMLRRKGRSPWSLSNPFWRYHGLQAAWLFLAVILGGWWGVGLLLLQAFVAIWQLELVNYVEHYGLQRQHIGDGKYEPVAPRHSWNATQKASNWLLINLQRHSDHHYRPARPFPLLQAGDPDETPELPFGYPVMTAAAVVPPLWRRIMNPRVRAWRKAHYPNVTDWSDESRPMPR